MARPAAALLLFEAKTEERAEHPVAVDQAAATVARDGVLVDPGVIRDTRTRAIALRREVRPAAAGCPRSSWRRRIAHG